MHSCEGCLHIIEADIRDLPLPDKYFGSAFASHILEHMPTLEDLQVAVNQLMRVADKVFIVTPYKSNMVAHLIHDHFLWVRQTPEGLYAEERSTNRRLVLTGTKWKFI